MTVHKLGFFSYLISNFPYFRGTCNLGKVQGYLKNVTASKRAPTLYSQEIEPVNVLMASLWIVSGAGWALVYSSGSHGLLMGPHFKALD